MRRLILLFILIALTSVFIFSQSAGARRYVAVQTVAMKDSNGFFGKDLKTLSLGEEVELVRDDGKWAQIRSGNVTGWVSSASLSSRRVVASGSTASVSEVALAGKGFSPDIEIEYKKSGLDYSMVDAMEKMYVKPEELERFVTEGRLARGQ